MMPPSETCDPGCGLNATLRIISGRWKPLVLFFLRDGPKHLRQTRRFALAQATHHLENSRLYRLETD
jgi:DNA-binding HxlR family transcriptional regulator